MSQPDPTKPQRSARPIHEFQITVAARPMQNGTIDVHVGPKGCTTSTVAEARQFIDAAVATLFAT